MNNKVESILKESIDRNASDFFLIPGAPLTYKVNGQPITEGDVLTPEAAEEFISTIYGMAGRRPLFKEMPLEDDDFSYSAPAIGRFRFNVYHQRGTVAAVVRVINFSLPDPESYNIPDHVMKVAGLNHGLVLVTGPAASGKSTTLACIIDRINSTRTGHIVTVEDPIEFIHNHKKSLVTQREVATDVADYETALQSTLRESPDVILIGEMRGREIITNSMRTAETGHLLFSTLHTTGAAQAINRIVDSFPAEQQAQSRVQLSQVLSAVISQRLVPTVDGEMIPVFETMYCTPAVRNLIRENKIHQIDAVIASNPDKGMHTLDEDLLNLFDQGSITEETLLLTCLNRDNVLRQI